jgi:zinc protease
VPLMRVPTWGLLAMLWSGCSRPALPAPELPLVASPDAPFRAKRPTLPQQPADARVEGLEIESAVLSNGLTLWVANRPGAPDTSLALVARDGGFLDSTLSAELLRLTTRALVEGGTRWFDGRTVDPPLLNGRRVTAGSGPAWSQLGLHVLSSSLPSAFKILSRTLLHPAFSDLDAVKFSLLKEAQDRSSSVHAVLLEIASAAAYGQPMAEQLTGVRLDELRRPDLATVQRCYRDVFRPEALALIAVGDVTLPQLRALAEPELGALSGDARPQPPGLRPTPPYASRGRRFHFLPQRDRPQAHVLILQPAPATSAVDDDLPFALLAELAIGAVRSRANNSLRHEQGVTYGAHPLVANGKRLGLLVIEADFEEDQAAQAITALLDILEQLWTKPVGVAELTNAKVALRTRLDRAAHDSVGLTQLAADLYASHGTSEQLAALPERLAAVTPADIQRVARKYLRPRDLEIAVAANPPLARELSFLGQFEVYKVERN